jgi:hypothetical protein
LLVVTGISLPTIFMPNNSKNSLAIIDCIGSDGLELPQCICSQVWQLIIWCSVSWYTLDH